MELRANTLERGVTHEPNIDQWSTLLHKNFRIDNIVEFLNDRAWLLRPSGCTAA
jgi:hypothetical protein